MSKQRLQFLLGCLLAAAVAIALFHRADPDAAIAESMGAVTTKKGTLLGYEKYKDYLSASKSVLGERTKFVGTTVVRRYTVNRGVESSVLGLKSRGALVVTYAAEFSFGYDLAPGSYDVVDTPAGIEIRVASPTVVAAPAVRDLHHQVLASGWFTDEKAAALNLYEESSNVARAEGARMQSDAEIVALCERTLTAFLHDFLAKQPGVKQVPTITVSYASAGAVQRAGTQ